MQRQDLWYKTEAESMGAIPTATKAGQFLVVSAQTGVNMETGEIIRSLRDLPPDVSNQICPFVMHLASAYFGPAMAQTWIIYQNLVKILAKEGASLKDLIRQRIYLRDVRDAEWVEQVMLSFFPDEKPTTLIMGTADKGLHPDIRVWVEAMALIPQNGGLVKEAIYLPELEKLSGPYPQAVKVGQFMFFEGVTGVNLKTGHPVKSFNDLVPEARNGAAGLYIDSSFEASKAQYWVCHEHIRQLLESQGADINDILHTYTFRRHGMRMFATTEYIRGKIYESVESSPTSEGFGVYKLSIIPDVEIITGGVARLPGEYQKEAVRCTESDREGTFAGMTKVGPFWFQAGANSTNLAKQQHIVNFSDCPDEGIFLADGRIDDTQLTMAKAWWVYKFLLDGVNAKPEQVIEQTVYLTNPSDWPGVERVANIIFKGRIPATTIIPVDENAFYWQAHMNVPQSIGGQTVEIGMWGLT